MLKKRLFLIFLAIFAIGLLLRPEVARAAGLTVAPGHSFTVNNAALNMASDVNNGGSLNVNSGKIKLGGNWSSTGLFDKGSGEVEFTGLGVSSIRGDNSFNNFKCVKAGKELKFEVGRTQTITGAFTITGSPGSLIRLRSMSDGSQWMVNPAGAINVSFVDVKDSQNLSSKMIAPQSSTDSGNNTNWFTPLVSKPTADFEADAVSGAAPHTVNFKNLSTGSPAPATFDWDFGDLSTSKDENPTHTYQKEGAYNVTLSVSNSQGADAETKAGYITVTKSTSQSKPDADFSVSATSGKAPFTVQFRDESTANPPVASWTWDFGDGGDSTDPNPGYTYNNKGIYTVKLTVSNSEGTDIETKSGFINVTEGSSNDCVANFTASPTSGAAPLTVNFQDTSTGSPASWLWDFGDNNKGQDKNPTHTYKIPGIYDVSLAVSTDCGEETVVKNGFITVKDAVGAPIADFKVKATSGLAPFRAEFEDLSTGSPASWAWNFGDGESSPDQNPTHTYLNEGIYSPSLKVSNEKGSDVTTKTELVTAESSGPPLANFSASPLIGFGPLQVKFKDRSTGDVSGWAWTFGDGATSNLRNPKHTYKAPGKYDVKLIASGSKGNGEKLEEEKIEVLEGTGPTAAFSGEPRTGFAPLTVQFSDLSGGSVSGWSWDFGDGETSRDKNPVHTYSKTGTYTVRLTASGADGTSEAVEDDFISALEGKGAVAEFTADRTTRFDDETGDYVVKFRDLSSSSNGNIIKRFWSFGDKGENGASSAKNPEHVYTCADNNDAFTVSLTIIDAEGNTATNVKRAFVSCEIVDASSVTLPPTPDPTPGPTPDGNEPKAEFSADSTSGPAPLEVKFSDESKGGPTAWIWDFGDGLKSDKQNPSHIYTDKGKYTVELTVSNEAGIDSATKRNFVDVKKPGCAASKALDNEAGEPSYSDKLNALRLFRDSVLDNTVAGIKLIKFYYYHSSEVEAILEADQALKAEASSILNRLIIELQSLDGRNTVKQVVNNFLSPGLVSDATALLDKIAARGGEELKAAIVECRLMIDE